MHPVTIPAPARWSAVALVALLGACGDPSQPGMPTTPATAAAPTASPAASPSPEPTATATPPAGPFRDGFDGPSLDAESWSVFEQSGITMMRDGRLEVLNAGLQSDFPYVVTRREVIPQLGPFSFELAYEFLAAGRASVAFCLDYLPPEKPGADALTVPFMRTQTKDDALSTIFTLDGKFETFTAPHGAKENVPHRLRIEFDGTQGYRVLVDGEQVGTFTSKRRPSKFWVGPYPLKQASSAQLWPRIAFDEVVVGQ